MCTWFAIYKNTFSFYKSLGDFEKFMFQKVLTKCFSARFSWRTIGTSEEANIVGSNSFSEL